MQRDCADGSKPRIVLSCVKRSMSIMVDLGLGGRRQGLKEGPSDDVIILSQLS